MSQNAVEVEIYGNKYKIRQPEGGIDVKEIAEFLDAKIKALAKTAPTASSLHLAVLAALNICHELFELKNGSLLANRIAEEKLEHIIKKIETVRF